MPKNRESVPTQHVLVTPRGHWSVKSQGAMRVSKTFDSKAAAISFGREYARKHRSELFIHRADGSIESLDSYGQDPIPPRNSQR
ncbi:MAG: DUF2188 domain-containing protein [Candidatus Competibacteraceae bacterium]|nr:DUF2188 domain-containing protein [Candidatus Competibacteraceae bacterium]